MQREKPEKGCPGIEIKWYMKGREISEGFEGPWWIVDVAIPDEESLKAVEPLDGHFPESY